jgi:hypothetical protein
MQELESIYSSVDLIFKYQWISLKCAVKRGLSYRFSKLLDETVRPVMFMQLLCTAVLLAFIGVLLSVSAAPEFACLCH